MCDFTYMWNLETKQTKQNKEETDLKIQRTNWWLPKSVGGRWGMAEIDEED